MVHAEHQCPECGSLIPLTLEVGPSEQIGQYASVTFTPTDLADCYAHQWAHEDDA